MKIRLIFVAFVTLLWVVSAFALEPFRPTKITTPPLIDGILDEPMWGTVNHVKNFTTFIPDFGKVPVEQTDVAMAYDEENIYFGFRCYEPDPKLIKTSVAARDAITSDDFVCLNLDTFGDHQAMYALYVNPSGIQADSRFAAGNEDFSQDIVWYSGGHVDAQGYTVEIQIPLKSIRYADADPVTMAVLFERCISRRGEHSGVPELDPKQGFALLNELQPMLYPGVKHYTLFELLPAVTYGQQYEQSGGSLNALDANKKVSLTTKYGITSDLILDGTVNPDFSQVESDAGQVDVNLRYSLYYQEKRPFFLEGKEVYTLGATAMSVDESIDPVRSIVYTRTIADPAVGAKLSGKLDANSTISALYAVDKVLAPDRPTLGEYVHVPVLRYKRALNNDSYIGGIFATNELWQRFNRVAGVDEQIRVGDGNLLESSALMSWANNGPGTSTLSGYTGGLRFAMDDRDRDIEFTARDISQDFRADMGYITRTGVTSVTGVYRPRWFPKSGFLTRMTPEVYSAQVYDKASAMWETSDQAALNFLSGNTAYGVRYTYSTEIFNANKFKTSGLSIAFRSQLTNALYLYLSARRGSSIFYGASLQGKTSRMSTDVLYQPSENIQAEWTFIYSDFTDDATQAMLYNFPIHRLRLSYQPNKYLFFRGIGEYNNYHRELSTDFLASFTYIPGTVIFLGYGSVYDKREWDPTTASYQVSDQFLEMKRGLFFKTSYLWRL